MLNLTKITYGFLYLMLLSPLLSYISFGVLGILPIGYYFTIFTVLYGIFFFAFLKKKIEVPVFVYSALLWALYLFVWAFFNGDFERRGLIPILINNNPLAVVFILIIIYNTKFSNTFIKNTVRVLLATAVIACIVSVIQVFNSGFLNALPYWREDYVQTYSNIYNVRRTSVFGFIDLNSLGLDYMPILAVLAGILIFKRNKLYLFVLAAGGLSAFFSNTRYVMVSFFLISVILFVQNKNLIKGFFRYVIIGSLVLIVVFQAVQYAGYDIADWFSQRLLSEGSIAETTRFGAITTFLYFFPDFYLFGNGNLYDEAVVAFSRSVVGSSHIHVGYLSHLVAYGVVGCFFLYGFWFLLGQKLFKTARKTNYWGSLFAFITFWWSFATFSYSSIFFYGLIFALVFDKYFSDNHKHTEYLVKTSK